MTDECHAARWRGEPTIEGPHANHLFTYGPNGIYVGHCAGRSVPAAAPRQDDPDDDGEKHDDEHGADPDVHGDLLPPSAGRDS